MPERVENNYIGDKIYIDRSRKENRKTSQLPAEHFTLRNNTEEDKRGWIDECMDINIDIDMEKKIIQTNGRN